MKKISRHQAYRIIEEQMSEFNRLTGRPPRAYEPEEELQGGKANLGYAYSRCLGEQDGNRLSVGYIINPGGGLRAVSGLTYLTPDELVEKLRKKLADPEWIRLNTYKP